MSNILLLSKDDKRPCHCVNCDWNGAAGDLNEICDVQERIEPGETVPAGQCPECGALSYLAEAEPTKAEPATVWLVVGEHWSQPGNPMYACATRKRANMRALELVRCMLDEIKFPHASDDWESELERLRQTLKGDQDVPEDELPTVTITELTTDLGTPEEEATKAEPDSVRRFLDLSTGHLKLSTREAMEGLACAFAYPHPSGHGWFVCVSTPDMVEDCDFQEAGPPDDLRACFDRARALGCDYIMFDTDGPQDDSLPYYEDGEEPIETAQDPETLTQFCDRLLGLGDQFLEDWADEVKDGSDDSDFKERKPEWQRARQLMLDAVELVSLLATMTDPHDADDLDGELNAFAQLIEKAQEITGLEPDRDEADDVPQVPETKHEARQRLLKERYALAWGGVHTPDAAARITAIDSELMLSESDIVWLNQSRANKDPDDMPF